MRFIVSDHIEGSQSFGKWKYTCFGDVRTWSDGERLCLWFGYGIEQNIEEVIRNNPNSVKDINGKFCVVMLWRDSMQVIVDYFCQTKVYYNTQNGLTVTNHLPLLPLGKQDVDYKIIEKFSQGWSKGDHFMPASQLRI